MASLQKPELWHALLQYFFSALSLRCKTSYSPHFDLNTSVELLPSHVPNSMAGGCHRSVLQEETTEQYSCQWKQGGLCYVLLQEKRKQSLQFKLWSLYCTRQLEWSKEPTHLGNRALVIIIEAIIEAELKRWRPHPSSILQHGCREHAPRHVGHLIPDLELELLNKWIRIVICTSHLEEFFHVT